MNSLNILSGRVSPQQTPAPSRTNSLGNILSSVAGTGTRRSSLGDISDEKSEDVETPATDDHEDEYAERHNEDTPLLEKENRDTLDPASSGWRLIPKRISISFVESIRWFLSTIAAPGVYLIAFLYDDNGDFAPFTQMMKLGNTFSGASRRASTSQALSITSPEGQVSGSQNNGKSVLGKRSSIRGKRALMSNSSSSGLSSESESERDRSMSETEQGANSNAGRHARSKSAQTSDEIAPARRSIRIKLHNEDSARQRKHRKTQSTNSQSNGSGAIAGAEISPATLKSPTSPASALSMTKYPRTPAPPRPLIPRRQPSYTLADMPSGKLAQKTLILDLDETLIHSMAKGGRMSTGHMVEVKLNTVVGAGGNAAPGPQHPILYYVHKRPHCDDFLRRVSLFHICTILY